MNIPEADLDLNLLVLFEAVYATGSISRAADMLGMNQPTASNALGRLRVQLDDPLFVREGKGVRPTERAQAMIEPVRRALNEVRSLVTAQQVFDPETTERAFRLHMVDVFEPVVMPPLAGFTTRNTRLSFKLLHPQVITGEDAVVDGLADLAIGLTPSRAPDMEWEELCPMDSVVIARRDHPILNGSITGPQLMEHGHVSLDLEVSAAAPGARANSRKLVLRKKMPFRAAIAVNRPSSMVTLVATSDLIGFLPRFYVQSLPDLGGLQILEMPAPLTDLRFFMMWNRRLGADPGLVWLREQVRASVAALTNQDL